MTPMIPAKLSISLLPLVLTAVAQAQTTFYVIPGMDPDGDLSWQAAVGSGFLEVDYQSLSGHVASIDVGVATATVQLLQADGSVSSEIPSTFNSPEFTYPGMIEDNALVNLDWAGAVSALARLRFEFSTPIPGFGTWIYDDGSSQDNIFVMTAEFADGSTASSSTLDAGTNKLPEGFLGVVSDLGVKAVTIAVQDLGGMLVDTAFELDHTQFALPPIGTSYCTPAVNNSTGVPAAIGAYGTDVTSSNALVLAALDLPVGQFGYFLASETQGFVANPGGSQGNLCLAGKIGRFTKQTQKSGANGVIQIQVDLANLPPPLQQAVAPGDTWNFQAWYRDKNPQTTSNFTDAVSVSFL